MVKSLHMQEGAQQHTLRAWLPAHGAISSSLLLPSTVGVTGWPSEGTASHWWPPGGNHDTETHPPPQGDLQGLPGCPCAGDHPGWPVPPPNSYPGRPTALATCSHCEDQTMPLTMLGNLALNFPREKESWGRCMTSLRVQPQDEEYLETPKMSRRNDCQLMEGASLALPADLDGAEWWPTGSLVQTPSKPWWCCQRGIMKSVGRTKGCTRKFKKPSMQWAADHPLFSPSGGPRLATRLINKLISQPKSNQELLGPSRGFLVFQCLNKHIFRVKNKMGHQGFMLPSPQGTY